MKKKITKNGMSLKLQAVYKYKYVYHKKTWKNLPTEIDKYIYIYTYKYIYI